MFIDNALCCAAINSSNTPASPPSPRFFSTTELRKIRNTYLEITVHQAAQSFLPTEHIRKLHQHSQLTEHRPLPTDSGIRISQLTDTHLHRHRHHHSHNAIIAKMPDDSPDEIFALIDECLAEQDYAYSEEPEGNGTDAPSRPPSRGTVFLDWDGTDDPVVSIRDSFGSSRYSQATDDDDGSRASYGTMASSYGERGSAHVHEPSVRMNPSDFRRRTVSSASPLALTEMVRRQRLHPQLHPQVMQHHQHQHQHHPNPSHHHHHHHSPNPHTHPSRPIPTHKLHGHDPTTNFTYSYNGRIIHIHRPPIRRSVSRASSSAYSEYYALDARAYDAGKEFVVVDGRDAGREKGKGKVSVDRNKPLPEVPKERVEREVRKREKVVGFIRRLMRVLDESGRLARLRWSLWGGQRRGGKGGEGEDEWVARGGLEHFCFHAASRQRRQKHTTPRYSQLVTHATTQRALHGLYLVDRTRGLAFPLDIDSTEGGIHCSQHPDSQFRPFTQVPYSCFGFSIISATNTLQQRHQQRCCFQPMSDTRKESKFQFTTPRDAPHPHSNPPQPTLLGHPNSPSNLIDNAHKFNPPLPPLRAAAGSAATSG
ncbi:uncharacterized protein EI97DRAFT_440455 [Westerdykella ornata]|uniref:Uncharacterized protein n=1 Tax=Westerdykella ornata TaxID=318751 RepID=A0A6A6JV93_WESOR|nr:uncharacterized protein EI97DRAFT_440455 [Westerdykella ornata]KAF2278959.1 hypothetical protein EI97DRAFT_440455 [Westerdykella ornata]